MALNLPELGTTRYTLVTPRGAGACNIEHHIWVDGPPQSYFDEETKDFVEARGRWQVVQVFGPFADRDAATEFMRSRADEESRHAA